MEPKAKLSSEDVSPPGKRGKGDISRARVSTGPGLRGPRWGQAIGGEPPRKRGSWTPWLILLACLAMASTAMLIDLGSAMPTRGESQLVSVSIESWHHQQTHADEGWSFDRLTPFRNGKPQLDRAPGAVWLNMLAYGLLHGGAGSNASQLYDARLVSVFFALLTIAAIFWTGYSMGGTTPAVLSALVCLSTPLFIYHARLATAQLPQLGFTVLAIAAALWAVRPHKPAAGLIRQGIGWAICGLSVGMATLTAGPVALPPLVMPLLVLVVLCPHRLGHLLGLVAAGCIAALWVTPWAVYVHTHHPNAWQSWAATMVPEGWQHLARHADLAGKRLIYILVAVLPWSLWLINGIIQPFSTSSSGVRSRMFLGWAWFVSVGVLLLAGPGDGGVSELLPVVPPGAVVVGQLFRQYVDLSAEARHAKFWQWARWVYGPGFVAAGLALPMALQFQYLLVEHHLLSEPIAAEMPWFYNFGALIVLTLMACLGLRYASTQYPGRALVSWCVWMVAAAVAVVVPVTRQHAWPAPAAARTVVMRATTQTHPNAVRLTWSAASLASRRIGELA